MDNNAAQQTQEQQYTHGGRRPGSGRPRAGAELMEKHTLTAPAAVWRMLEEIGKGNRSRGLRRIVEQSRK